MERDLFGQPVGARGHGMQLVSGVRHAGEVLELFTPTAPEWGAADVGRTLGISRSHAHRLLCTLAEVGLLDKKTTSGQFRLSWTWFAYSSMLFTSDPLVKASVPILRTLNSACGFDSMLAVWSRGTILSLRPTAGPVVTQTELEDCMTVGLVLMAGLVGPEVDAVVSDLEARNGFPQRAKVEESLQHVRSGGVLTRAAAGTASAGWDTAAPVVDGSHNVVAALAVRVPAASSFTAEQTVGVVKNASLLVTSALARDSDSPRGMPPERAQERAAARMPSGSALDPEPTDQARRA